MSKEKETLCFQWKKGENYGLCDEVQQEKKIGEIDYYVFTSGRLINKALIDEFLVEIPSLNEPMFDPDPHEQIERPPAQRHVQTADIANDEYLSEADVERLKSEGKLSLGKAKAIPHPDDLPPPVIKKQPDTFVQGLPEDGKEHRHHKTSNTDISKGLEVESRKPAPPPNPFLGIIDKAKKKDFELELLLNVKLPVEGFFTLLDDDYIQSNLDNIMEALINKIKQSDLDSQIKENLIRIYNIKIEKE